jgi:hypothetical protein
MRIFSPLLSGRIRTDGGMARRQSLGASSYRMARRQSRHSVQRPGQCSLARHAIHCRPTGTVRRICSRTAPHHPLAVLAIQHVLHVHPRGWRTVSLGLEMDLCGGFVLVKTDRRNAHVHGQQIRSLRQVAHDALTHSVLAVTVFLAAAKQDHAKGGCRDGRGAIHIPMIAES